MGIVVEQNKEELGYTMDKKILQEENKHNLEEKGEKVLSAFDKNDEIWIWIEKL